MERVARKQGIAPEEARKIIDQMDKMRENYVKKYTGTSRYDTRNSWLRQGFIIFFIVFLLTLQFLNQ